MECWLKTRDTVPSETRAGGGIGPEIFNTLYFALLSTVVTLPVAVASDRNTTL